MFKLEEIVRAWVTKFNPTPEQQELALKRLEICMECPSKKFVENPVRNFYMCGECGCPLEGKSHSPNRIKACPLDKWEIVDKDYRK